jgi:hypothetical protein
MEKLYKLVNGINIELSESEYQEYYDRQPTTDQLLAAAKDKKKVEIKKLRDSNLEKPTPQSIEYDGNLSNRSFAVSVKIHLPVFESIIAKLNRRIEAGEDSPTREWTDSSGERLQLTIEDYKSLANHLDERDEQEYSQARLKIELLESLDTLEEIGDFDINEVY